MPVPAFLRRGTAALAIAAVALLALPTTSEAGVAHDAITTLTDGADSVVPGTTTTYTLTVANTGATASGTVAPTFSAGTVGDWTCVAAGGATCGSGSGTVSDAVNLPTGGSVTYTIPLAVPSAATADLVAEVTFTTVGDTNTGNDNATDTDTLTPQADASITKTDNLTSVTPGLPVTYTVVATNLGPSDTGATVADVVPTSLEAVSWTCAGSGGGLCTGVGSGPINDSVTLPDGASVTYTISATVALNTGSSGEIVNVATVDAAVADLVPANDTATDTDTVVDLSADLVASKTGPATATVGSGRTIAYTIGITNAGPDLAREVFLRDPLPTGTTFVSATQDTGPTATLALPVVGNVGIVQATWPVLANDAVATFTIVVQLGDLVGPGDTLTNTATVGTTDVAGTGQGVDAVATIDPTEANDTASVTTTVVAAVTTATTTATAATITSTTVAGSASLAITGDAARKALGVAFLVLASGGFFVMLSRRRWLEPPSS